MQIQTISQLSFAFQSSSHSLRVLLGVLQKSIDNSAVVVCCSSHLEVSGIQNILFEYEISSQVLQNIDEIADFKRQNYKNYHKIFALALLKIEEAFEVDGILFVPDTLLIGTKLKDIRRKARKDISRLVKQASTLNNGDIVVHRDYGVCIFNGLNLFEALGKQYEMIELSFRGQEQLFIPIERVGLITKYHQQGLPPEELENILDSFTNKTFSRKKAKTKEQVRILAEKIVKNAALRKLSEAKMFSPNATARKFYDNFKYLPTPDQQDAIEDIENDLTTGNYMERLVCGDVGFGKTEVAMRAACLIVSGKAEGDFYGQVAIIVPTTILARQHYKNFVERFSCIKGINIAELSRNVAPAEQKKILQNLADGKIDIIIGTHGLLSKKTTFKNLQLVIIDEEQHFGVAQKEKLKEGRDGVHFLYLSATPIPRSLNMALSGLRDISVISTPPVNRVNVKTIIMDYEDLTLRNAIMREKARGGRVFFVCARVAEIESREEYLQKIVPELKVCVAHGQMSGETIDKTMVAFYEGKYDILLTTTIIESGVDISFANTMIIHNANLFGLAALYQLRGRVGRSGTQAYCYLIVNAKQVSKNEDAMRRLKTIASITSLGAGFGVATSDMDIRGAGNIVGDEQSGNISCVGTELYIEMINEEIEKIKNQGREGSEISFVPEVKVNLSVLIPKNYIADYNLRVEFYKKISMCVSAEELLIIQSQMQDRFGPLPDEVKNLIHIIEIRELCHKYFIDKLDCGSSGLVFSLHEKAPQGIVAKVIKAVSTPNSGFVLKSNKEVAFLHKNNETHRFAFIKKIVDNVFAAF